jgi:hypothetical protein
MGHDAALLRFFFISAVGLPDYMFGRLFQKIGSVLMPQNVGE